MDFMKNNRKYYHLINGQKMLLIPGTILPKKSSDMLCLSTYFTSNDGNIEYLEKTFNILLKKNDALRIKFKLTIRGLRQYFDDYHFYKVPIININSEDNLLEKMNEYRHIDNIYFGTDLCNAYIFSYNNKATILINMYHVIIDGYSLKLLTSKFINTYFKLLEGKFDDDIDNNKYTFEQFISENEFYYKTKKHKNDLAFYNKKFNENKDLKIIGKILKPKSSVNEETFALTNEQFLKVNKYCEKINIPVSYFLSCVICKALCRISKNNDICYFSLNHGRPKVYQKDTIGNMIGAGIVFYHNDENIDFKGNIKNNYLDYLQCIKHGNLGALEYILCGFKHSLKILRFNYFNIVISCLNFEEDTKIDKNLEYGMVPYKYQPTPFYCTIQNTNEKADIVLVYQSRLITKEKLNVIKNEIFNCIECVIKGEAD